MKWKLCYFLAFVHMPHIGPVRFVEKTSQNTVPVDLLWEKNTVSAEKISWKVRITTEANRSNKVSKGDTSVGTMAFGETLAPFAGLKLGWN